MLPKFDKIRFYTYLSILAIYLLTILLGKALYWYVSHRLD